MNQCHLWAHEQLVVMNYSYVDVAREGSITLWLYPQLRTSQHFVLTSQHFAYTKYFVYALISTILKEIEINVGLQ